MSWYLDFVFQDRVFFSCKLEEYVESKVSSWKSTEDALDFWATCHYEDRVTVNILDSTVIFYFEIGDELEDGQRMQREIMSYRHNKGVNRAIDNLYDS